MGVRAFFTTGLLLGCSILCFAETSFAAPKKYFWGWVEMETGSAAISFQRQASNLSDFRALLTISCTGEDGSVNEYPIYIHGDQVPDIYVNRNRFEAEFEYEELDSGRVGTALVSGRFTSSSRARVTVGFTKPARVDSPDSCMGILDVTRLRRGMRIRD